MMWIRKVLILIAWNPLMPAATGFQKFQFLYAGPRFRA